MFNKTKTRWDNGPFNLDMVGGIHVTLFIWTTLEIPFDSLVGGHFYFHSFCYIFIEFGQCIGVGY